MKVLVSACLLGVNCKYNGGNNLNRAVVDFVKDKEVIEICPEIMTGLPLPRPPVEIVDGVISDVDGNDVDALYRRGVALALQQIKGQKIDLAILQSRSPTCGVKQIYDGSFSKKLINGQGIFAQALAELGITVVDAADVTSE